MNHPADKWLSAYHDGELRGERLLKVEAHLADCEACRQDLEAIRSLSVVLKEFPPAALGTEAKVFTARVLGELGEDPRDTPWERALRLAWQLAPLGILILWAFIQAALTVTGLLGNLLPVELTGSVLGQLLMIAGLSLSGPAAAVIADGLELFFGNFQAIPLVGVGVVIPVLYLVSTAACAVLLWGWLASWLAYRRRMVLVGAGVWKN